MLKIKDSEEREESNEIINKCKICGEPTQGDICNTCKFKLMLRDLEKNKN